MRRMVMEFPIIVQNSVIRMVQLEKVLQRPAGLFLSVFDIVGFDRRNINDLLLPEQPE